MGGVVCHVAIAVLYDVFPAIDTDVALVINEPPAPYGPLYHPIHDPPYGAEVYEHVKVVLYAVSWNIVYPSEYTGVDVTVVGAAAPIEYVGL